MVPKSRRMRNRPAHEVHTVHRQWDKQMDLRHRPANRTLPKWYLHSV